MAKDLKSGDFPAPALGSGETGGTARSTLCLCQNQAQQSIDWYFRKRQPVASFLPYLPAERHPAHRFRRSVADDQRHRRLAKALHSLWAAVALRGRHPDPARSVLGSPTAGFDTAHRPSTDRSSGSVPLRSGTPQAELANPEPTPEQQRCCWSRFGNFKKALGIVNDETKGGPPSLPKRSNSSTSR